MSTCLHQAYIDQMVVSNGAVFVINIKLSDNSYLDLMPNCEYNNSDYKIDFQTPIESPFENVYKYNGIEKTVLLSLDEDNSQENLNVILLNNNQAKTNQLEGILFLEDIFWCENTGENKNIQLEVYNNFQFLNEIDLNGDFITIESNYSNFLTKLNNNNLKGFYLFDNEKTMNNDNFVINNNNFTVIINTLKNKKNSDYGNFDSFVFLSIMLKNSKKLKLKDNIINYLKNTIQQYYQKFSNEQKEYFRNNFSELSDLINSFNNVGMFSKFLNSFTR